LHKLLRRDKIENMHGHLSYLDNCSFNRPHDDQSPLRSYLKPEAKPFIQGKILQKTFKIAWSYIRLAEIRNAKRYKALGEGDGI
jgi:hypothetical protein